MADPTSVPDAYLPNEELTWVQKATHIWALHPTDPLKADKGGLGLQLVTGAAAPPLALASPENTMEFHGGTGAAASYYRTLNPMIFGDDPVTAGNQTPPAIGGIALWVYIGVASTVNLTYLAGQPTINVTMALGLGSTNRAAFYCGASFSSSAIILPTNQWVHLCGVNDATLRRTFINGAVQASAAQNSVAMANDLISIGQTVRSAGTSVGLTGRIRQVMAINGAIWTDAEILEMYNRPYAYYGEPPPPPAAIVPHHPDLIVTM